MYMPSSNYVFKRSRDIHWNVEKTKGICLNSVFQKYVILNSILTKEPCTERSLIIIDFRDTLYTFYPMATASKVNWKYFTLKSLLWMDN